ncbi:MAG: glycosyltransferase family 1 protein [Gammaproteobacteria bacterium]|nr:glycosyltransferase family 1 protein [Gammaproteobacteria bacterium]
MHVGIDASNLRQGGGVTHLSRLLSSAEPGKSGIDKISVWACRATAALLPARPWLEICSPAWVESGLVGRTLSQQRRLPRELLDKGCDVLFSPGGTLPANVPIPTVTMSQNMLPFEPREAARFGVLTAMWLKMQMLRQSQGRSFKRADGVIFLTQYAMDTVHRALGSLSGRQALVPHGIERRFLYNPRPQRSRADCNFEAPFRFLYVSIAMPYKHQIAVAHAVSNLRNRGMPVEIQFVGAPWGSYGRRLRMELDKLDVAGNFLHWSDELPFEQLHEVYLKADAFVFASSCENLPNIMIEAMAAGLPIASSSLGPMPEVLGDAGVYFSPDDIASIACALEQLMNDPALRARMAELAFAKASEYSWEKCADDTFHFLAETVRARVSQ